MDQFYISIYTSHLVEVIKLIFDNYKGMNDTNEMDDIKSTYFCLLRETEQHIRDGDIEKLIEVSVSLQNIHSNMDNKTVNEMKRHPSNPLRNTDFFLLSCKHNQTEVLLYASHNDLNMLISNEDSSPFDRDQDGHNAFYYAIRSNNIALIKTLLKIYEDRFATESTKDLEETISGAYFELNVKNVPLSEEMKYFVEDKLIGLRFFSDGVKNNAAVTTKTVETRVNLLLENLIFLTSPKSKNSDMDLFLFVAKETAKNVQILKNLLKCTYVSLPWEEMEFCLICFVSAWKNKQELSLLILAVLSKTRIMNHLKCFKEAFEATWAVEKCKKVKDLSKLQHINRDNVVEEVLKKYPEFQTLYDDYTNIRNVYTLDYMTRYIGMVSQADPRSQDGKMVIIRALQFIGEHLKNSVQSPKLSKQIINILFLSAPNYTREIMTDLRNSLSHSESLTKRIHIEKNEPTSKFVKLQEDIVKLRTVIIDTSLKIKLKIIQKQVLSLAHSKVLGNEALDNIRIFRRFPCVNFNETNKSAINDKIEKYVIEIDKALENKTPYQQDLINKIKYLLTKRLMFVKKNYSVVFSLLSYWGYRVNEGEEPTVLIKDASALNEEIQSEQKAITDIRVFFKRLYNTLEETTLSKKNSDTIYKMFYYISFVVDIEAKDISQIQEFHDGIVDHVDTKQKIKKKKLKLEPCLAEEDKALLKVKLASLENLLVCNDITKDALIHNYVAYSNNIVLQAAVEMLMLDIMSLMEKSLENNHGEMNMLVPLLNGKVLRNHLAHHNSLVDILHSHPSKAVISNAIKVISEDITECNKVIGKAHVDDPAKSARHLSKGVDILKKQKEMFDSLERGEMEHFMECVKSGADIFARDVDEQSAMHYAAKGPSLDLVKLLFERKLSIHWGDIDGRIPLHLAAMYGRLTAVEYFIENGSKVDIKDKYGKSALHFAAKNGHTVLVEFLLQKNANYKSKEEFLEYSPLHLAIENNHLDIAKMIIVKGDNVDWNQTRLGYTALHSAAKYGRLGLVDFLVQKKANVNAFSESQNTPLHLAASHGHLDVIRVLAKTECLNLHSTNLTSSTALHCAVDGNHLSVARFLLENGVMVDVQNTDNYTPLLIAAKHGNIETIKLLLEFGANIDAVGANCVTALHLSILGEHIEAVKYLIQSGADLNVKSKDGATPLHVSTALGFVEIVDCLIQHGADIRAKDRYGRTVYHVAIECGLLETVETFISQGVEMNEVDYEGSTVLHFAVKSGQMRILETLSNIYVDLNVNNMLLCTPLHVAVEKGIVDMIEFLISHDRIDIGAKSANKETPLHLAVENGDAGIVKILLNAGANVNSQNAKGLSCLHYAVKGNFKEIVKLLIESGSSIDCVDASSKTPLCYAAVHNHTDILELLINHGADVNIGRPLFAAVNNGYKKIFHALMSCKDINIDIKDTDTFTLLHIATIKNQKHIAQCLLDRGMNPNVTDDEMRTSLQAAAQTGHADLAEVLLKGGADVNFKSKMDITAMHVVADCGFEDICKMFLEYGGDVNARDLYDRLPTEIAALRGHIGLLKLLLLVNENNLHYKDTNGSTLLHIVAETGNVDITKMLIEWGANVRAKDNDGITPIVAAAKYKKTQIMDIYFENGVLISECNDNGDTLLHLACVEGNVTVSKYLIEKNIDINIINNLGLRALDLAAVAGHHELVDILLCKGSLWYKQIFNLLLVQSSQNPILSSMSDKFKLIILLFKAVGSDSLEDVKKQLCQGAHPNARNESNLTPIFLAVAHASENVFDTLLEFKADPESVDSKGCTPLHYAARVGKLNFVKKLLANGAIYNLKNEADKTPLDVAGSREVFLLLSLVDKLFDAIQTDSSDAIYILKNISDRSTMEAVMNARDVGGKSILLLAMSCDVPHLGQIRNVAFSSDDDFFAAIKTADKLLELEKWDEARNIYNRVLTDNIKFRGIDEAKFFYISNKIAWISYLTYNYDDAHRLWTEIHKKQKIILGECNKFTLKTERNIALALYGLKKYLDSFHLLGTINETQIVLLGKNHKETLRTVLLVADVIQNCGKLQEALLLSYRVIEENLPSEGLFGDLTIRAQHVAAVVLTKQGEYDKAMEILEEVYEKNKIVHGEFHSETVGAKKDMVTIYASRGDYDRALDELDTLLECLKANLDGDDMKIVSVQNMTADVMKMCGKYRSALQLYKEVHRKLTHLLGPNHVYVQELNSKIESFTDKVFTRTR